MYQRIAFICLLLLSSEVYPQYFVSWSPDGTQLAFNNVDGIYIVSRDGSGLRKLAADVSSKPSWLPDGRVIFRGEGGIYSIYPDGSQWTLSFEGATSVSPDGNRLLFGRSSGELTSVLEMSNADGSGRRVELYTFYDTDRTIPVKGELFVWAPDSGKFAFRIAHGQGITVPVMLTVLPNYDIVTRNNSGDNFSWAPDSKRIAFDKEEDEETGRRSIYVVDIDTKKEGLLVEDAGGPVWSPDGRYIAFSRRDSASVWDIYVLDMETNTQIRLTADSDPEYNLVWSPDSVSIAYMSDFRQGDGNIGLRVRVIDVEGGRHITPVERSSWGEVKSQFYK
jgi:Tol biopolymer transport system component